MEKVGMVILNYRDADTVIKLYKRIGSEESDIYNIFLNNLILMEVSMHNIDFVIPWVDGSDERWRAEKKNFLWK